MQSSCKYKTTKQLRFQIFFVWLLHSVCISVTLCSAQESSEDKTRPKPTASVSGMDIPAQQISNAVADPYRAQQPFSRFAAALRITSTESLTLPTTAKSDPNMVLALRQFIDNSGGIRRWDNIKSAELRVTMMALGSKEAHDAILLDDWSSNVVRYRRAVIGMKRPPIDHDGAHQLEMQNTGRPRYFREFDQARLLAGSLPAAAAEIILKNSSYIVQRDKTSLCPLGYLCANIFRKANTGYPFVREEEWFFDPESGMPKAIDLVLPNLSGQRPVMEEFQFVHMTTQDGLLIPEHVRLIPPGGGIQSRTLVFLKSNVPFDKRAFDEEIEK